MDFILENRDPLRRILLIPTALFFSECGEYKATAHCFLPVADRRLWIVTTLSFLSSTTGGVNFCGQIINVTLSSNYRLTTQIDGFHLMSQEPCWRKVEKKVFWEFDSVIMHNVSLNRPVSYSNSWTGCSMKWRLMRAN